MRLVKSISYLLVNIILLFSNQANSQSLFEKGFKDGFAKGYCYQQPPGCLPKVPFRAPNPTIKEVNSFEDGYNRGFVAGVDYRRASIGMGNNGQFGSSSPNNKTIYKSNPYVLPIDLSLLQRVLEFRQSQIRQAETQQTNPYVLEPEVVYPNYKGNLMSLLNRIVAINEQKLKPLNREYASQVQSQVIERINYFNSINWKLTNEEYNIQVAAINEFENYIYSMIISIEKTSNVNQSTKTYNQPSQQYSNQRKKNKVEEIADYGEQYWGIELVISLFNDIKFRPLKRGRKEADFIEYLRTLSSIHFDEINKSTAYSCRDKSEFYYNQWKERYGDMDKIKWEQSCKGFIIIMTFDER